MSSKQKKGFQLENCVWKTTYENYIKQLLYNLALKALTARLYSHHFRPHIHTSRES